MHLKKNIIVQNLKDKTLNMMQNYKAMDK